MSKTQRNSTGNQHNDNVLANLAAAHQVARGLANQGQHIQAVCAGNGQPQIWIRNGASVRGLDAYTAKRGRDCNGQYEIRSAVRNGVAINWIIRHNQRSHAA